MKITVTIDRFTVLRWLLGVLLIWAAVSKLANPSAFLASMLAYSLPLPDPWLRLAGMGLPWVELFCGLLLVANVWRESVLVLLLGLFPAFLLVTGQAWARGLDISCGCFHLDGLGVSPTVMTALETPMAAFLRTLVLTAITAYLLHATLREERLPLASDG